MSNLQPPFESGFDKRQPGTSVSTDDCTEVATATCPQFTRGDSRAGMIGDDDRAVPVSGDGNGGSGGAFMAIERRFSAPAVWSLLLVSTVPMLVLYFWGLWQLEHYQFFPLLLVFVGVMVHSRGQRHIAAPEGRLVLSLVVIGLLFNALSIVLFSPWFAVLAFVSLATAALMSINDNDASGSSLVILAVPLISLIRLPLNLDSDLILGLQGVTTRMSSWFLDLLLVPHRVDGNIMQLVDRDLFVAEACSGIQSVFTLLGLASVVLAYRRRPVWMVPGYWIVGMMAAVVCNSLRVTIISVAAHLGIDWATGLSHTLVGYVSLLLALGVLLSFDQCVDLLIHPIQGLVFEADDWVNPLVRMWDDHIVGRQAMFHNRIALERQIALENAGPAAIQRATGKLVGGEGAVTGDLTGVKVAGGKEPAVELHVGSIVHAPAATEVQRPKSTLAGHPADAPKDIPAALTVGQRRLYPFVFTAGGLLVLATVVATLRSLPDAEPVGLFVDREDYFRAPQAVLDPVSQWLRPVGYEQVQDRQNPRLGQMADVWAIAGNGWQGQLVLSQAYTGWHELCVCYSKMNWHQSSREVIDPATIAGGVPSSGDASPLGFVLARFDRASDQRGYLLFSGFTYQGEVLAPPAGTGVLEELRGRLSPQATASQRLPDGVLMLQLWIEASQPLPTDELVAIQRAFQIARSELQKSIRHSSQGEQPMNQTASDE